MRVVVCKVRQQNASADTLQFNQIDVPALTIGRATDRDIFLAGLQVALEHAEIRQTGKKTFSIESRCLIGVQVNDKAPTQTASLTFGDRVRIGRYQLTLVEPPEGLDLTVNVEELYAAKEETEQAANVHRTTLAQTGARKRIWAWSFFLLILLLLMALPLATTFAPSLRSLPIPADVVWDSGPISRVHQHIAEDCELCHAKPFVPVRNQECQSCHSNVKHHTDNAQLQAMPEFAQSDCTDCHREHGGDASIIAQHPALCTDCHADPERFKPFVDMKPVSDFSATGHPEFSPSLQQYITEGEQAGEWTFIEADMSGNMGLREDTNLLFPHDKHLNVDGIQGENGETEVLVCADCHKPDIGKVGFRPIQMETDCQRCHDLEFDPDSPDVQLPHGSDKAARQAILAHYSQRALEGNISEAVDPRAARRGRNRTSSGTPPTTEAERKVALAWAKEQAELVISESYGPSRCGYCHKIDGEDEPLAQRRVAPANLAQTWFTGARFSHKAHLPQPCSDCHAAETSATSEQLLLPGVAVCRDCHTGTYDTSGLSSNCLVCHGMHIAEQPLALPVLNKPAAPKAAMPAAEPAAAPTSAQPVNVPATESIEDEDPETDTAPPPESTEGS